MKFYKKSVIYLPSVWGGFPSDRFLISINSMKYPILVFWGYCYKYRRPADKQQKVASYIPEPGKSQDHQQVPRLVRPVSWFLDCLLLLPVLAAWQPIPSWPEPSQSPCLLVSSPRAGWSLRAHKPNSPLQSVSIPCIISVLWNNLSFPKGSIYIHFVICSLGSWK